MVLRVAGESSQVCLGPFRRLATLLFFAKACIVSLAVAAGNVAAAFNFTAWIEQKEGGTRYRFESSSNRVYEARYSYVTLREPCKRHYR